MDILVIVAHADDDTLAATYLAKAVLDEGRKAAVLHVTSSASGWNTFGRERKEGLGLLRRAEASRALKIIGVDSVWFLDGIDFFSQNVLASLASLGHGKTLDNVVRVVRATRPEVIITWLPQNGVGQNHGGHQASGILATEAFDCSADPSVFPAHISSDGLLAWQAKKLYYMRRL
ncbi:PIG-L family deacetylase [bacterium]|nr:PIG-L family deacetylase [bacterium]MCI0618507.1 PIG-L family deacetylase [bacterium]